MFVLVVVKICIKSTQRGIFHDWFRVIRQCAVGSNRATDHKLVYPCLCRSSACIPGSTEVDASGLGKRHVVGTTDDEGQVDECIASDKCFFDGGITNILLVKR